MNREGKVQWLWNLKSFAANLIYDLGAKLALPSLSFPIHEIGKEIYIYMFMLYIIHDKVLNVTTLTYNINTLIY